MLSKNKLEQLFEQNRLKEQQKGLADSQKESSSKKNICPTCAKLNLPPPCKGHGGGGGSDSAEEESDDDNYQQELNPETEKQAAMDLIDPQGLGQPMGLDLSIQTEDPLSMLEELAGLLYFNNDSEKGILTIHARPGLSAEERWKVSQFLHLIKNEFEQFKLSLEKQGITTKDFSAVFNKDEGVIRIPSPKYYDQFIQQLVDNKLMLRDKAQQENSRVEAASPNPLVTKPTPSPKHKNEEEKKQENRDYSEPEQERSQTPSPLSTILKLTPCE